MCGIVGYWALAGRDLAPSEFHRFVDSLAHRGPDGSGVERFGADRLWLGHRRLSIIDTSDRGRQPMSYANGRYWLTFNGEIYNYIELRDLLRQLGHQFATESDSEVVLAAYAEWGADCQTRFNGMWAFAIWDDAEKCLFLSRDRFGVKPLHYADIDGGFSFASELRSFLQLEGCSGRFDENVVAATLRNVMAFESTPVTLLPGVQRLPGGHCLMVRRDGRRLTQWWRTEDHLPEIPAGLDAQAERFRELFLDSCRIRLRSDVPVATSLSGGLDSSAVACAVAELGRRGTVDHVPDDWQRAFVACFPGTTLDERRYAEQIVAHTGMRAHYHDLDATAAAAELEDIIFDLEEIFTVPLVGAWTIYRQMRRNGIRVSLDGHGADEVLGGYSSFVDRLINEPPATLRRYNDLKTVRAGLSGGTDISTSGALLERRRLKQDVRFLGKYALKRLGLLDNVRPVRAIPTPPISAFLNPAIAGIQVSVPDESDTPGRTDLSREQYRWFHTGLLPTFLRCIDRASMAHGIEVRSPFMDWRLVTFAFALPDESKIGGGLTKRILRLAMRDLMPDPVRLRTQKIHFSTPIAEWGRGALKEWLLDLSASRSFLETSAWDGPAVRAAVEQAVTDSGNISTVWPILNAHVLQERFKAAALARPRETEALAH
jgi:asparagine synthase (glutamine-hydrolysing)